MKRLPLSFGPLLPIALLIIVACVSLPVAGCATTGGTPGQGEPSPAQLHAAARVAVTASEKSAITLNQSGALKGPDWDNAKSGILGARALLYQAGAASIGDYIPQIIAALKVAGYAYEAAQVAAQAATLTEAQIALYEQQGLEQDAVFDKYTPIGAK